MMRHNKSSFLFFIFCSFVLGTHATCRNPKKVLTQQQKALVAQHVLSEVPSEEEYIPVNANFDDKITLVGYKITKTTVKPGESTTITYYWKPAAKITGDWKIFVHLDSERKRKTYDHYAIDNLYPPSNWKVGEVIEDIQTMNIDGKYPEGPAHLWVGFFDVKAWKDSRKNIRLKIKDAGTRRADKQNRLLLDVLHIGEPIDRNIRVYKVDKITVDGKLDEPEWKQALVDVGSFVKPGGQSVDKKEETTAGFLWDDENLYIAVKVSDSDVRTQYTVRDEPLWKGKNDVVEIFLDPQADLKQYIELQVAPNETVFDALFQTYRTPGAQKAAAQLNMQLKVAVKVDGTINQPGMDKGYVVEVAIPWKEIPGLSGPPSSNTIWAANIYRLSNSGTWALTWIPVGRDFHELIGAGRLTFVDTK